MGYNAIAFLLSFSMFFIAVDAAAMEKAQCEILTVQASNDGTGIAPSLSKYKHLFTKKPFSAYNSFKLIDRQVVDLTLQVPRKLTLPDNIGGALNLNGSVGKQLDLTLTLARKNNTPIHIRGHASPGSPLIAAGMNSPNGIWVFGIVCTGKSETISY